MKIRVQQRDGTMETLSLVGPVEVVEGDVLSRFKSAEGLEHFFTADGHYDGWGMVCSFEVLESGPTQEVADAIERVQNDRDIEPEPR